MQWLRTPMPAWRTRCLQKRTWRPCSVAAAVQRVWTRGRLAQCLCATVTQTRRCVRANGHLRLSHRPRSALAYPGVQAEEGEELVEPAADTLELLHARRLVVQTVARRGPLTGPLPAPAAAAVAAAGGVAAAPAGGSEAAPARGAAAFEAEMYRVLGDDEETFNIDVAIDQEVRRCAVAPAVVPLRWTSSLSLSRHLPLSSHPDVSALGGAESDLA